MYSTLLLTHSVLRYFVLIFLMVVIVKSFMGYSNKQPFGKTDNKLSLFLFSVTHTQLLVGIILYFVSDLVQFNAGTMKNDTLRYWTMEHNVIMFIAIVFITLARTTSKKMSDDTAKHKRMFIFNTVALVLILVGITLSKRGLLSLPMSGGE